LRFPLPNDCRDAIAYAANFVLLSTVMVLFFFVAIALATFVVGIDVGGFYFG
jgi:hypothetical protein